MLEAAASDAWLQKKLYEMGQQNGLRTIAIFLKFSCMYVLTVTVRQKQMLHDLKFLFL